MNYWILIVVTMVLGFAVQAYISSSYKKYSAVRNDANLTGAQIARRMLDENGLSDVDVVAVAGTLSDHYDPRSRVVRLSEGVYSQPSVSAMAIACHECGHAIQHARGYVPMKIRSTLVPVANLGSSLWFILVLAGIFLNIMSLFWAGIVLYSFAVLFHVVTLPVEFNASRRGLSYINGQGSEHIVKASSPLASSGDASATGAKTVLTAAALTYVVGALTSIMQLMYYIGMARRR